MISLIISSLSLSFNIKRPYYYDRRIHNLGHLGFPGQIHAEGALLSTKIIDRLRYNGINIRKEIMKEYKNDKILDLCCGVGVSTMNNNIGIDTSPEMLKVARRINKEQNTNKRFYLGNAENFKPKQEFDIVSCMFAFHEMPLYAHNRIIEKDSIASAQREAKSGFGDDRVFIERYVEKSRHIEIQILGDSFGNVIHLGERECSIQRRHQKIIEESPSPRVSP